MSPIPIDRKRCKAIVRRNLGTFCGDDTGAEVCAHVRAPLSVFRHGHPKAPPEIGERPFPFSDGCRAVNVKHDDESCGVLLIRKDVVK